MSDYTPNPNSGTLFDNRNKEEGDNKPDLTGSINIGGELKNIAMWLKEAKNGNKYYSVKISDKT